MNAKTRKANATKEKNKLEKIFKAVLDDDEYEKIEGLIENAAFMRVSLRELQVDVQNHGYVEEYCNGENQYGTKDSSYLRAYNNVLKSYNTTMKQLITAVPSAKGDIDDGFDAL